MRTPEEKEKIVKEYYKLGQAKVCHKYNISRSLIWNWVKKYEEQGLEGLKSQTGKTKNSNPHAGFILENQKTKLKN